jgi:hypothetical protein
MGDFTTLLCIFVYVYMFISIPWLKYEARSMEHQRWTVAVGWEGETKNGPHHTLWERMEIVG